ncbi:hypothetical protein D3C78_1473830 [compost metagenome]
MEIVVRSYGVWMEINLGMYYQMKMLMQIILNSPCLHVMLDSIMIVRSEHSITTTVTMIQQQDVMFKVIH